jgi:2-keto-4-pentenoate hydratase/2-oxohepta-3-ene-1,7-dioic acid hydratase in catechol pathway
MEQETDFQRTLKLITSKLDNVPYNNGDISDIGNEIGIAVGSILENISEEEINNFISGFRHGVSLTNGTH